MKVTVAQLQHTLDTLDAGVLKVGVHREGSGEFCAFECLNKTVSPDSPTTDNTNGIPDYRAINDIRTGWTDIERTTAMLPLIADLSDAAVWSSTRRQRWTEYVAIHTVRRIVANLPYLPESVRLLCRKALTLVEACAAARATRADATRADAADAAAAYAASAAAYAAGAADAAGAAADAASAATRAAAAAGAAADAAAAYAAARADAAAADAAGAAGAYSKSVQYIAIDIWREAVIVSDVSTTPTEGAR